MQASIARESEGRWRPGPGSIYLILGELLKRGFIVELPKRGGTVRRYVIASKGREELARLSREAEPEVAKLAKLLSLYAMSAGNEKLRKSIESFASELGRG